MKRTQITVALSNLDREAVDRLMIELGDVSQNEAITRAIHVTGKLIEIQKRGYRISASKKGEIEKEMIIF